ncbi:DNA glycosylase [Sistotremastrum niveocremeum HHB9708]|uniref:Endonuclease III homolog n=2 Tax=Sistotremastraceae TaxID=3402574 RepID=A0A165AD75_9AGAM|nr:DNA glycosylase [Sistotremastrum niveocremeum HHB9708]KZT36198.1 DNA glycosylase [Sistotremastrum suecicum HHB10207 ss-3]
MPLQGRVSEYNVSVTLYEPESGRSTRSSLRKKHSVEIADLEDVVIGQAESSHASTSLEVVEEVSPSRKRKRSEGASTPTRKSKSLKAARVVAHPAPPKWEETYSEIKRMRETMVAPVDTMGCDRLGDEEPEPKNQRFTTLISLMLSSQTKDEVTAAAIQKLRASLGGQLSVENILKAPESDIQEAICKVGFWRRKSGYIKQTAAILLEKFESDVPKTIEDLCSLPGVGPKMGYLCLQAAWNLNHGIGVDVHVHRITNRLGWHKPPTKDPEDTRINLESWLPKELHGEINAMLVGFGQVLCLPVNPRCDACTLSTKKLCPSARRVVSPSKAKIRTGVVLSASDITQSATVITTTATGGNLMDELKLEPVDDHT